MKTQIWRKLSSATFVALVFTATSAMAADDPASRGTAAPATNAAPQNVLIPSTNVPVVPAPAAPNAEPVKVLQLPKLSLPPLLDQVVKLSQSGTDEAVIRAYVEKAAPPYRITGNEIVQLRDLGISQGVIMSLIEHSQTADASSVTEVTTPQTQPQPQAQMQTNAQTEVASAEAATEFYDTLSPYGTWVDVQGYGLCWQPTVVVVNSDWRPYCDGGYWLWSDQGWYWHSYYSWGWAPFHYGRWFSHANRGWLWCPDRVWGPSWVCWRNSATFCGWAPLPPGACFTAGIGWTHHGRRVGIDFGFGITAAHFTFVGHDRFSDRHVGGHSLRGHDAASAYRNTSVVNNYAVGANNRVINHGVGRDTIAAASHTPIREVAVRELPTSTSRVGGNNATMPDRVSRAGNSEVVFRPGAQISAVPRTTTATAGLHPAANQSARQTIATRSTASSGTALTQSRAPGPVAGRTPAQTGRLNGNPTVTPQRAMPNYSQNYVNRGGVIQPNRSVNAAPALRANPTPQYQARIPQGGFRPSAPAQRSFAPSAPAQRFSSPSAGRTTAPSVGRSFSGGGAMQSRGSVSHSAGGASRSVGVRR
jgi:hypothetical protein